MAYRHFLYVPQKNWGPIMKNLVATLRKEHEDLLDLLKDMRALGLNSEEGRQKFFEAKALILDHLKKEDELIYPTLKQHPGWAEMSSHFSEEMMGLAPAVLGFFEKYESENISPDYSKDLGRLMGQLKQRISKEEMALYPAVLKASAAQEKISA